MNPYECESPGLLDSTNRVVYPLGLGLALLLMSETIFFSVWKFVGNTGLQALPNNCFKDALTDVLNLLMLHAENRALDINIYINIYIYLHYAHASYQCFYMIQHYQIDTRKRLRS